MKATLKFIAALAVGGQCLPAYAAPLEAYGQLPSFEQAVLSPEGDRAAFVTTVGDKREIIVQSLSSQADVIRIAAGENKLRDLYWAGSNHLLILLSQATGQIWGHELEPATVQTYDLRRREADNPMAWLRNVMGHLGEVSVLNQVLGAPIVRRVEGKPIVYLPTWYGGAYMLYRVDLERRFTTGVQYATDDARNWLVDANGEVVGESGYDEKKKRWSFHIKKEGNWVQAQSEQVLIDYPQTLGLAPEDGYALFRREEMGDVKYRYLSLSDGTWGESLADEQSATQYLEDPVTHRLIGGVRLGDSSDYVFFDRADQAAWDHLKKAFPGQEVTLASWSDDRQRIIVNVFGKRSGAVYMLYDRKAGRVDFLGRQYAGIAAQDVAEVRPIRFAAADGLQIPAYLTLPIGHEPKGLPLVVLPHGGPASRDNLDFDWWAQALASRGYAVLQVNFRGSWGLGWKFQQAGFGEWGRKMQTDLSDGVRYLVQQGIADPKRACIVGGSYGGYAALAGAALDRGVYRCAVSYAGLSDVQKFLVDIEDLGARSDTEDRRVTRYLKRYFGVSESSDPALVAISPARQASQVDIPVLLIHGDKDAVVPYKQSEIMAEALKKAGKPYELVKLSGEDHWLSRAETRLAMLKATVAFLEKHNPP